MRLAEEIAITEAEMLKWVSEKWVRFFRRILFPSERQRRLGNFMVRCGSGWLVKRGFRGWSVETRFEEIWDEKMVGVKRLEGNVENPLKSRYWNEFGKKGSTSGRRHWMKFSPRLGHSKFESFRSKIAQNFANNCWYHQKLSRPWKTNENHRNNQ